MVLLFNYNNYQKIRFLNASNIITASIYNTFDSFVSYFRLSSVNEELASENARLRDQLDLYQQLLAEDGRLPAAIETSGQKYSFTSTRVVNNSVNKQYNYLILDKGLKDSIKPDQGIISGNRVVGIVNNVSQSYSIGLPLLNKRLSISGKLKNNNYFGSVSWEGTDYRFVNLNEIPPHVEMAQGDTVVTSGYSAYFPEGMLIGTVESFELKKGESFYTILVRLTVDFKSLTYVEILANSDKEEIIELESMMEDGQDMD